MMRFGKFLRDGMLFVLCTLGLFGFSLDSAKAKDDKQKVSKQRASSGAKTSNIIVLTVNGRGFKNNIGKKKAER